jgi:hypothetical protein
MTAELRVGAFGRAQPFIVARGSKAQAAKKGAFKHCFDGFGPILEQMRKGPLR